MVAHDLAWAEEKKMGSFISVSRGSDEPLRFLELHYKGAANKDEGAFGLNFLRRELMISSRSSHCLRRQGNHIRFWRDFPQGGRRYESHARRHGRGRDFPLRSPRHR